MLTFGIYFKTLLLSIFLIKSQQVAASFLLKGLRKGDRIAILGGNHSEWLYTAMACAQIGINLVSEFFLF